ncbi:MAG: hypothetical protein RL094_125, partial [Candidatus Parcubacteria bacterium]
MRTFLSLQKRILSVLLFISLLVPAFTFAEDVPLKYYKDGDKKVTVSVDLTPEQYAARSDEVNGALEAAITKLGVGDVKAQTVTGFAFNRGTGESYQYDIIYFKNSQGIDVYVDLPEAKRQPRTGTEVTAEEAATFANKGETVPPKDTTKTEPETKKPDGTVVEVADSGKDSTSKSGTTGECGITGTNLVYCTLAPISGFIDAKIPINADGLTEYLNRLFRFGIALAGVLAVFMIVFGG